MSLVSEVALELGMQLLESHNESLMLLMARHYDDTLTAVLFIEQSHNNVAFNAYHSSVCHLELELLLTFFKMTPLSALGVALAELQASLILLRSRK